MMSAFTVTNTADSGAGSLRDEIGLANLNAGANTIDFDSTVFNTALTITLTGSQLELSNTSGTETISGPAAGVTVSGGGLSRVFQVDASVTALISGLTITGGRVSGVGAGAGLANYGGTTTLTDCSVSGNSAVNGGGLYTGDYGSTTLYDCTVRGNSATENGGGLDNYSGTTMLNNCTISGNSAAGDGGGISNFFGRTTLTNCGFSGDLASENGGGLYSTGGNNTLTDCTFSGDSASENGGGLENLSKHGHAHQLHLQRRLRL